MAKKKLEDDQIFRNAKNKINTAIEACGAGDVENLVKLVSVLTKMKQVEMSAEPDDWGGGLGGDA